jgi:hypothetical protein
MKPVQVLGQNHTFVLSEAVPRRIEISVGTLATLHVGSDDYSYIVTKISPTGKTIYICRAIRGFRGKWQAHPRDSERIQVRKYGLGGWRKYGGGGVNWCVTFGAAISCMDRSF